MNHFNYFALTLLAVIYFAVSSQAQHYDACPTPDIELVKQRISDNKEWLERNSLNTRSETKYVPVKFHLVARNDGSGRVSDDDVYEGLCILNKAYEGIGLQFYLKDNEFNYFDNTQAYENPVPGMLILNFYKDEEAMNIYITGQAGSGPGSTTLGYYSPSDDWIICRKDEITDIVTLPHEVGHFFSLMHTFQGWGCDPYDEAKHGNPVNSTISPCEKDGSSIPVELVDRSNCDVAGDMLCGTPPDYNFGLGWSDCNYDNEVKDPNGDVVDPMENNYMSYFLSCTEYQFTQDQIDMILADYNSNSRDYLRTSYEPTSISDPTVTVNMPQDGSQTQYKDYVEFDWEEVDGATSYILEINKFFPSFTSPDYRFIIHGQSHYELNDDNLGSNTTYHYRITPFSDYSTCLSEYRSQSWQFETGSWAVATEDISRTLSWEVYPNPITNLHDVVVKVTAQKTAQAQLQIIDTRGRVVSGMEATIQRGDNTFNWNESKIPPGVYMLRILTDKEQATQRIIIQ